MELDQANINRHLHLACGLRRRDMGYPIISQITQDLAQNSWSPVGDTVDPAWPIFLRFPSGKAHLQAAVILARVVYMYRPARENVLDPESGLVNEVRLSQKFKADLWQTSRQALADTFGFTVREVDAALKNLRESGVIFTELRTLTINGVKLSNVLYIGLNLPELKMISTPITFQSDTSYNKLEEVQLQKATPVARSRNTYTKTPLKTPLKTTTTIRKDTSKKSSSSPAKNSTAKSEFEIPETIMNLIPENKRNDNELSKVSAALAVSSEEVVGFNISRALAKAKKDDPWGMVSSMLNDLAFNNIDWYAADRERIAEKNEKHAASRKQGAKAEVAMKTKEEREAREVSDLQELFLQMPVEVKQIVEDEARRRVELYCPGKETITLVITDVIRDIQNGVWKPSQAS